MIGERPEVWSSGIKPARQWFGRLRTAANDALANWYGDGEEDMVGACCDVALPMEMLGIA